MNSRAGAHIIQMISYLKRDVFVVLPYKAISCPQRPAAFLFRKPANSGIGTDVSTLKVFDTIRRNKHFSFEHSGKLMAATTGHLDKFSSLQIVAIAYLNIL